MSRASRERERIRRLARKSAPADDPHALGFEIVNAKEKPGKMVGVFIPDHVKPEDYGSYLDPLRAPSTTPKT